MHFTKMHGLGNDFMVIDAVNQTVTLSAATIKLLADRHRGVGFDQCLLIQKPKHPETDFYYRIFNASGDEVGQCGNGARCAAQFINDNGLSSNKSLLLETSTTRLQARFKDDGRIQIDMGEPQFEPENVPYVPHKPAQTEELSFGNHQHRATMLSIGNPHAVIITDSVDNFELLQHAETLARTQQFPDGVNLGVMEIIHPKHIKVRVYERGAGETLACGSGACAAVIAGINAGKLDSLVTVDLPGGSLDVHWEGPGYSVTLSGTAPTVYQGTIKL